MTVEALSDPTYLRSIIRVSLSVSLTAVLLSTFVSLPIAFLVGFSEFRGKRAVTALINTGMGFPSVVVGLVVLFVAAPELFRAAAARTGLGGDR
jgi:tungstate transport system permease protein